VLQGRKALERRPEVTEDAVACAAEELPVVAAFLPNSNPGPMISLRKFLYSIWIPI
jgi:hypothetical protein